MHDINKIAEQIRFAFATGRPCRVPLMTVRELGRLLALLQDDERAAA
ncbi:hypothetical protein [Shigella flexneri]|nr:hypothetical protein [Escherichia coli]